MKRNYYEWATLKTESIYDLLKTSEKGLSSTEASKRLDEYGENIVHQEEPTPLWKIALEAYLTPFTLILVGMAAVSFVTGDLLAAPEDKEWITSAIILVLVVISGTITFVQNVKSQKASADLESLIEVTAAICRDGDFTEIRTENIVIGDVIKLSAGDMIPADLRLLQTKDLFMSQTSLTGESYPVEKMADAVITEVTNDTSYENLAFTGSEVISGSAIGVVICTGADTLFGEIAKNQKATADVKDPFDEGIERTSKILVRFTMIMAPLVILINGLTKGDWLQALLFGISVAVGLTPEMLPMIVSTNLVKGANDMAKRGTIIRNLKSIQNFGAIDVLCTDKTGTLTQDKIVLEYHLDIDGKPSSRVLRHAYLNSYYQTGLKNLMDIAIIEASKKELDLSKYQYEKIDEIPFDFNRRRMSVVVKDRTGKRQMITKGAIEEMLAISDFVDTGSEVRPMTDEEKDYILKTVDRLNAQGLRVIGVAQKSNPTEEGAFSVKDESEMVLMGYLAFLDPPKETTAAAIQALHDHYVDVKVLTGDNALVTRSVCEQVGLSVDDIILGEDIINYSDEELQGVVEDHNIFVKLNPTQKARLVDALRKNGHVVGYMGDGINDSPAMHAADVAISVDNAVDIAKESADIILLEKDLMILEQGIIQGRQVFGNIMKYIKATTSSNFGNIFSVLIASIFLPFLPMTPVQLLVLNLVYDISCMSIPWDHMDVEYLREPKKWTATNIKDFMIWFGPTSSIFDVTTFAALFFILIPGALNVHYSQTGGAMQAQFISLFHTGWFIVSLWTQTLVLYSLRTPKLPIIESSPSFIMTTITLLGIVVGTCIPYTAFGDWLGLQALPVNFWSFLLMVIIAYLILVTIVKHIYVKRFGRLL